MKFQECFVDHLCILISVLKSLFCGQNSIIDLHEHFLNLLFDLFSCCGRLFREFADLICNDGESAPCFACTCCFDRGIQCQQVGLRRNSCDIGCHLFSILPPFNLGNTTMGYGLGGAGAAALNAPAGIYRSSDGWIALALSKETQFRSLAAAIGRADLLADARFDSFETRARHLPALLPAIDAEVDARKTAKLSKAKETDQVERLKDKLTRSLNTNRRVELEDFFPTLGKWMEVRAYPFAEGLAHRRLPSA